MADAIPSAENSKRVPGKPFQPGQSGNPGGRPRYSIRQYWQERLEELAPGEVDPNATTGALAKQLGELGLEAVLNKDREQLDCIRGLIAEVEGPHKQAIEHTGAIPIVQLAGIPETEEDIPSRPITEQDA